MSGKTTRVKRIATTKKQPVKKTTPAKKHMSTKRPGSEKTDELTKKRRIEPSVIKSPSITDVTPNIDDVPDVNVLDANEVIVGNMDIDPIHPNEEFASTSVQGVRQTALRVPPATSRTKLGLPKQGISEREKMLLFRNVLSEENMKHWTLKHIQNVSEHLAAGYKLVDGRTNRAVFGRTPILRVRSANLHKLGVSAKAGNPPTMRKYKLTLEVGTDPDVDSDDPSIATDQKDMADMLMKARDRIAELFWEIDVTMRETEISTAFESAVDLEKSRAEEGGGGYVPKKITREDKEVLKSAKFSLMRRMASWIFSGNKDYPADDPKGSVIRLKRGVFVKNKKSKDQAPAYNDATFNSYRPLGENERGGDGNENDDYSDLTDEMARDVEKEVISQGYYRNKFIYSDHNGKTIPLGTKTLRDGTVLDNHKDPCMKVIDQNDYVKCDFSFWVYVLRQGTFGISMNLGKNICVVRKGIPNREERIATQSKAAMEIVFPLTNVEGEEVKDTEHSGHENKKTNIGDDNGAGKKSEGDEHENKKTNIGDDNWDGKDHESKEQKKENEEDEDTDTSEEEEDEEEEIEGEEYDI
jgi:hypothetical protein